MRRRFRKSWRAIAATGAALLILLAAVVGWRASRALRTATEEVRSEREIRFTVRSLPDQQEQVFESISPPAVFFQAAQFHGDLYVAGPAGLSRYNAGGTLLKHYAVGQELPSSPLIAIAPAILSDSHEQELVIATAQAGLLVFNGTRLSTNLSAGCRRARRHLYFARSFRTSPDRDEKTRRAAL